MSPVSSLATLYTAVYGQPPSSHSTAALLAMEQILGLTAEDPLSRMMIVLVNTCDRMDGVALRFETAMRQRSEDETMVVGDTKHLVQEIQKLVPRLGDVTFLLSRHRARVNPPAWSPPVVVDTYRMTSPMLTYLRKAFDRRNSVDDHNHVVGAARWDLFFLCGIAALIMLAGIGVGWRM